MGAYIPGNSGGRNEWYFNVAPGHSLGESGVTRAGTERARRVLTLQPETTNSRVQQKRFVVLVRVYGQLSLVGDIRSSTWCWGCCARA